MSVNRRLLGLGACHLVLGIIAGILAPIELRNPPVLVHLLPPFGLRHILLVPLFASALCQALLLALWGATSRCSPWKRLAGLVAGAVYLEALFPSDLRREFLGISTLTIVVATATLLVVRALGVGLTCLADPVRHIPPEAEGFRFSIRDLMLLTAAVALLSAGARALQESPKHVLLLTAVWALCFVAVGLVSVWAVLGNARPLRRVPVVFALSPVLGSFFAYAAGAHRAGWVYIDLIMLLYPTLLLGSLLVVRSCGYRLVRRAASVSDQSDSGSGPLPFETPASGVTSPE